MDTTGLCASDTGALAIKYMDFYLRKLSAYILLIFEFFVYFWFLETEFLSV